MKSASCSSGGPSGEPGNERLKFAPDGHSRVYACDASGEAHGITISWPVHVVRLGLAREPQRRDLALGLVAVDAAERRAPSGPSPPLIDTIGTKRCDQPLVFVDRGSSSRPNCLPGASRSIEQWTGDVGHGARL